MGYTRYNLVSQINANKITPTRGGVIIYTVFNGIIYFGFALDTQTHELTDFAGGIHYEKGETCIEGCLREFTEESLGIFGDIQINDEILASPVIYDEHNMIIFLRTSFTPDEISKSFNKAFLQYEDNIKYYPSENCAIVWLTYRELRDQLSRGAAIYYRTRKFLKSAGTFIHYL